MPWKIDICLHDVSVGLSNLFETKWDCKLIIETILCRLLRMFPKVSVLNSQNVNHPQHTCSNGKTPLGEDSYFN